MYVITVMKKPLLQFEHSCVFTFVCHPSPFNHSQNSKASTVKMQECSTGLLSSCCFTQRCFQMSFPKTEGLI